MAYDYIIVGGGSAGCVLANRLSADPSIKVLLLEAGGSDWNPLFRMPAGFAKMTKGVASWGWSTVPQKHLSGRVIWYTQAKVIGGGSSINAQLYTRGNAKDYDAWASEAGATGWSYREVLPYFKRSEDNQKLHNAYHAYGGPLGVSYPINPLPISYAFLRAAQELGIPLNDDFNGAVQDGIGHYQLSTRNAERSSASTAFVKPITGRKNLTVRLSAQTLKIEVQNGRAIGVTVASGTGTETLNADREIIISCGAIGSPRLLQLSGIGPADALKAAGVHIVHDLPGVGSNMQDHLDLYAISECTGDHTYDRVARPHRSAWAGLQYLAFKTGPVTSTLFETGGFWYADRQARSPDIQFHLGLGSGIEAGVAAMKNPGVTLNSAFLRPRSRGTVRIASADPSAAPLIDPNYWADPYDRECSIKGLRTRAGNPASARLETVRHGGTNAGRRYLHRRATRRIRLSHLQDGPPSRRNLRDGFGRKRGGDARSQAARPPWHPRRRRFGHAVRSIEQHQRADNHGGREGLRPRSWQGAAAGGGD